MCAMHILCKTGTVCLRVVDPHFIFGRICVRTIRTHMNRFLTEDRTITLKKVLSFYPIPLLPPLLSGGEMYINYTSGSIIEPAKQWVVVIKVEGPPQEFEFLNMPEK